MSFDRLTGAQLRAERLRAGRTIRSVARVSGMSHGHLSGVERGSRPVTPSVVDVVIVLYATAGWDPLVQLFFWGGTSGGLGVLMLITGTSIAVLGYFLRRRCTGESRWSRRIAPLLATVALLAVTWLALAHFATLLGVPESHPLRWGVPLVYLTVGLLGAGWGLILRNTKPDVYAGIGLGARAVTSGISIAAPERPNQPGIAIH